jgi:hypothetical protein
MYSKIQEEMDLPKLQFKKTLLAMRRAVSSLGWVMETMGHQLFHLDHHLIL